MISVDQQQATSILYQRGEAIENKNENKKRFCKKIEIKKIKAKKTVAPSKLSALKTFSICVWVCEQLYYRLFCCGFFSFYSAFYCKIMQFYGFFVSVFFFHTNFVYSIFILKFAKNFYHWNLKCHYVIELLNTYCIYFGKNLILYENNTVIIEIHFFRV